MKECHRCGRFHNANKCPAVNWKCYICQEKGHISRKCYNKDKESSNISGINGNTNSSIRGFSVNDELGSGLSSTNIINHGRKEFKAERIESSNT